mmetsp:Transcript_32137/g.54326  ORF Transcript_32137/g.54326 Transcript_32137/m.54326 type:complete len:201 (+) Transcript_32137:307-909(+)
MRAHWLRLFENISIIIMESSSSWTKYEGHDKSSNSTAHVHRSTSCEVNHTRSPKRLLGECRKESIGTPESMGADRVDEPTQEDTVAKVRHHLATFSDSTGNDGREGTCKSELEEPELHVRVTSKKEACVANECFLRASGIVSSVGKRISETPKAKGSTSRVEEIPKENVLDVLLSDTASAEHGKSKLHEEDEGSCKDEIE